MPDASGAATYTPWLRAGLGRGVAAVAGSIVGSEEFANRRQRRHDGAGEARAIVPHMGLRLVLPPDSPLLGELGGAGYEPHLLPRFLDSLRPGMTVLDCGASLGTFAIPAAARVGPAGKVVAVEVAPRNGLSLLESAAANGLGNLQLLPLAAWDRVAVLTINAALEGCNHRLARPGSDGQASAPQPVPALPLDLLAAEIGAPAVMKLDIEGAEHRALLGARGLLAANRPLVFTEYFPELLASVSGVSGAEYLHFLLAQGYAAEILHRERPAERLAGLAPAAAVARVEAAHAEARGRHGATHLDLCFHPLPRPGL